MLRGGLGSLTAFCQMPALLRVCAGEVWLVLRTEGGAWDGPKSLLSLFSGLTLKAALSPGQAGLPFGQRALHFWRSKAADQSLFSEPWVLIDVLDPGHLTPCRQKRMKPLNCACPSEVLMWSLVPAPHHSSDCLDGHWPGQVILGVGTVEWVYGF